MLTQERRKELVRRCIDPLSSKDVHAPSAWFNFIPPSLVNRENFVEWLYWVIFSSTVEDGEEFMSEVDEFLAEMEQRDGTKLIPGHNPKIKPIRVTLDPVQTAHRPLIWYLVSISLSGRGKASLMIHLAARMTISCPDRRDLVYILFSFPSATMPIPPPLNLRKWLNEHQDLLQPPSTTTVFTRTKISSSGLLEGQIDEKIIISIRLKCVCVFLRKLRS